MKAIVTSKGRVTIPIALRTQAKITAGSELDFQMKKDGTLKARLLHREISQLKGIIKSKKQKSVSLNEMKKAIRDASTSDR